MGLALAKKLGGGVAGSTSEQTTGDIAQITSSASACRSRNPGCLCQGGLWSPTVPEWEQCGHSAGQLVRKWPRDTGWT